jgi:hypothetical protein
MSTPRGKPPNPIALSTHVSHKAHEGAVTEPPGFPYAPKRAHQRAGSAAAAEHHDLSKRDRDLEQLEAILHSLQRQESATRSPRASPRSLVSERLAPPPEMPRRHIGASVGIVVAIILAATIAYYFAVGGWAPSTEPASGPQTASDPTVASPPSWSAGQQAPPPTMAEDDNRATSAQTSQSTKTSQPARSSEGETGAIVQPDAPGAQIPPASKTTRVVDPEEITLLMKQGEQFIAAGDVVTARIVFQRAAEAGDADAAVALGATYDPVVLANLGVAGLSANVEKARIWYQKAENLGSTEATRRLAILENR